MIRVTRRRLPLGAAEVTLTGHAQAPQNLQGHDLVCAAASILCLALARIWKMHCPGAQIRLQKGSALFRGAPEAAEAAAFEGALEGIFGGFLLLARDYPRCLEVREWT